MISRNWLPWLDSAKRREVHEKITIVAEEELKKRHWGARAGGKLTYGIPRFLVTDIRGAALVSGMIRYHLAGSGSRLFYRGQTSDYPILPGVFRDTKNKKERQEAIDWLQAVLADLPKYFDPQDPFRDDLLREGLAQHYGLPTAWIDVVDHFQTAAWFAYEKKGIDSGRDLDNEALDDSVGYVYLLAAQDEQDAGYCRWRDLRIKPSNWLRPHIQQAFVLRLTQPIACKGLLSGLVVSALIVPRTLLRQWSNHDSMPYSVMYPNAVLDRGLFYWNQASKALIRKHGHDMRPASDPLHNALGANRAIRVQEAVGGSRPHNLK